MAQTTVSEDVKRLITRGTVKENADAFMRLAQGWVADLRKLQANDKDAITRVLLIAKEASSAAQIVQDQVRSAVSETGEAPLSQEEIRKMNRSIDRIRPETVKAIARTHPGVFGEPGDGFLKIAQSKPGFLTGDLCAAYIRSAREAKKIYESNPESASNGLYFFFGRAVLLCNALMRETKTDELAESTIGAESGMLGLDVKREIIFAKYAVSASLKAMQDYGLELAPGGMQVSVLHSDAMPMAFIRIPVTGEGSVARANSAMNEALAKILSAADGFKIPEGVHISLRRVA